MWENYVHWSTVFSISYVRQVANQGCGSTALDQYISPLGMKWYQEPSESGSTLLLLINAQKRGGANSNSESSNATT
jgi:hypothetical protein